MEVPVNGGTIRDRLHRSGDHGRGRLHLPEPLQGHELTHFPARSRTSAWAAEAARARWRCTATASRPGTRKSAAGCPHSVPATARRGPSPLRITRRIDHDKCVGCGRCIGVSTSARCQQHLDAQQQRRQPPHGRIRQGGGGRASPLPTSHRQSVSPCCDCHGKTTPPWCRTSACSPASPTGGPPRLYRRGERRPVIALQRSQPRDHAHLAITSPASTHDQLAQPDRTRRSRGPRQRR